MTSWSDYGRHVNGEHGIGSIVGQALTRTGIEPRVTAVSIAVVLVENTVRTPSKRSQPAP